MDVSKPVLSAAARRAILGVLFIAAAALIDQRLDGVAWEQSIYLALKAAIAVVISRGLIEGFYDSNRAVNNNTNAGDVPNAAPDVVVTEPAKP